MVEEFDEAPRVRRWRRTSSARSGSRQAAARQLRSQGAGHLIHISSIGALAGHPSTGLYSASKFALEGMAEALAAELRVRSA